MKQFFRPSRLSTACLFALCSTSLSAFADPALTEQQSKAVEFTLITGDKVSAVVKNDGSLAGIRLLSADDQELITSIFKRGSDIYLVPEKAKALVDAQAIDLELFNISKLHQSGYDDASTPNLPVLIEYSDGTLAGAATPHVLAGTELIGEVEIIDVAAFGIQKDKAAEVFAKLTADGKVEGVWLDAMVHAYKASAAETLTTTVPLTGAYGNYASPFNGEGVTVAVLDTGYDIEHSDLNGQVVASKDFTWSRNGVDDLNGHGTHVAATVAGTGQESDGKWVGMAPGANLLVGKVLGNTGGGSTYGILSGMQWAVDNGADIINMSLGGTATYCGGPMVDLIEAYRNQALFVIAAGNSFTRQTVGSPGCAPSALTVGAIDRDNNTASFSSRGPSPDGHSAKPDIASQGVNVVAGASGGNAGTAYRSLSGTSMASPHVAGGAALLMQARPELSPQQVKSVLTSSAVNNDSHVLEQGAGPMDVNQAMIQAVVGQANQELGIFPYGLDNQRIYRDVSLQNLSDEEISLKLKVDFIGEDGNTQLPATIAGLDTHNVVIPANGSIDLPVWVDPGVALRNSAYGTITGRIIGTSTANGEQRLSVPVSFWIQAPQVELTINAIDMRGKPATSPSRAFIVNDEDDWGQAVTLKNGQAQVSLPKGDYTVVSNIMTYDNDSDFGGLVESAAQMAYLNKKIESDTYLEFDARTAQKVEFKTDQPISTQGYAFGFTYALDDNKVAKLAAVDLAPDYVKDMYLWSQGHDDRFRSFVTTRAYAPQSRLFMANGQELDPVRQSLALTFHGEGSAQVVNVGDAGYATDWSQFELEGKIALIAHPYYVTSYMVQNVMNQGAIGVLFYRPGTSGRYKTSIHGTPKIPVVGLSAEEGELLAAEIIAGNDTIRWSGTALERSPYAYSLHHITDGHSDGGLIRVHDKDLHTIDAKYHAQNDERPAWTDVMAMTNSSGEFYSTGSSQLMMLPMQRKEYYTATPKNAWTNVVMPNFRIQSDGAYFDGLRLMTAGANEQTEWFKGPRGASLLSNGTPIAYRDTNVLTFKFPAFGDSSGHDGIGGYNGSTAYGIQLNGEVHYLDQGMLSVPDNVSDVRLEVRYTARGVGERSPVNDKLGSYYQGIFHFNTDASIQGAQRLLVPVVDVPVDIDNAMSAGQAARIKITGMVDTLGAVPLTSVRLQYGYGQECMLDGAYGYSYCPVFQKFSPDNWQDAQIEQVGDDWFAIVPNDAAAGEFVHLRIEVADTQSSTSEQTTLRAYMLK
ncbi:S8 family serine peptidase [Thalassotalea mangrovi]|uniref:Peptidase S8 n=1 Tax=Thalassotalea mangrovi TaxID=2572245 RepID=A0A4U1B330_9GAMM|nr:S8 family serine peptidase [Thalassotalea mangrovi]TKB43807.1 peptidase S8 [Thalassotalea mangrovi]